MQPMFNETYHLSCRAGHRIGLSLSNDIVKAHDDEITVGTEKREGATFTLKLPAKD